VASDYKKRGVTDSFGTFLTRLEHVKSGKLNGAIQSLIA